MTAVCLGLSGVATANTSALAAAGVRVYPQVDRLGQASAEPLTTADCAEWMHIACYGAPQLQQAYDLPALYASGVTGLGQTIVVVDPFGSPTIRRDLAVFDATYHLPPPPSLSIIAPVGHIPAYKKNEAREGWAGETTLDVEYAHAIAPGASILLVETPTDEIEGTSGFPQIVAAENYVVNHHLGAIISQSFGATEETFPTKGLLLSLRSAYVNAAAHGVTVLAASGDDGTTDSTSVGDDLYLHRVTSWPASDPLVTAVGGTTLHLDGQGQRTRPDTAWNDTSNADVQRFFGEPNQVLPFATGGGESLIFARPAYQSSVDGSLGARRSVPDIAMSAACNGAVEVYQSFPGVRAGWYPVCGTSEAAPLFAGIVALADQVAGHPLGLINPALYALAAAKVPGLLDVSGGTNTVAFTQHGHRHTVTGYAAAQGYDRATGLGTIDAATFVPELAAQP